MSCVEEELDLQVFVLKVMTLSDEVLNVSRAFTHVWMHVCLRVRTYVCVRMLCLCFCVLVRRACGRVSVQAQASNGAGFLGDALYVFYIRLGARPTSARGLRRFVRKGVASLAACRGVCGLPFNFRVSFVPTPWAPGVGSLEAYNFS